MSESPSKSLKRLSETLARLKRRRESEGDTSDAIDTKAIEEDVATPSAPPKSAMKPNETTNPPFNPFFVGGARRSPRLMGRPATTTPPAGTKRETSSKTQETQTNSRPHSTGTTPKSAHSRSGSVGAKSKPTTPVNTSKRTTRSNSRNSNPTPNPPPVVSKDDNGRNTSHSRDSAFRPINPNLPKPVPTRPLTRQSAMSLTQSEVAPIIPPVGMANLFQPMIAAENMLLKEKLTGEQYSPEIMEKVRQRLKENFALSKVHEHFMDEMLLHKPVNDVPYEHMNFHINPNQLTLAPKESVLAFDKQMRKIAGTGLGRTSPKIKSFLNAFVTQAGSHKLNASQLANSLPQFFDDTLNSMVSRKMQVKGFVPVSYTHLTLPTIYSV